MDACKTTQKVDRRVVKTQKAIRQAFRKLASEKDIGKITVSALAREADIDRKTFYLHFPSIDALVEKESNVLIERVAQALTAPAGDHEISTPQFMRRVLAELKAVTEEDAELYRNVIAKMSIDQMVEALREPVRKAVLAAAPAGFKPDDAAVDYAMRFYIAGTLSIFTEWFTNDRNRPIESIVDVVEQAANGRRVIDAV